MSPRDLEPVFHVIIPALNEERSLADVLGALSLLGGVNVIVVDNGSIDRTAAVAREGGAYVVHEPFRGYGAACLAGISALDDRPDDDVVAFLDADGSDDPTLVSDLLLALDDDADLVLASRTLERGEPGALSIPQRFGNWLACTLIGMLWGARFTDLAPCRALRLGSLRRLNMEDRGYGWTVEMQIRAARNGLKVIEIPSRYRRRRHGRSKISGSIRGSILAGLTILGIIGRELIRGTPAR